MDVWLDGGHRFDQDDQHNIRVCHAEEICCSAYDYEQGDRCAALYTSADIINGSAYLYRNPDMFYSDSCCCSGGLFHQKKRITAWDKDIYGG